MDYMYVLAPVALAERAGLTGMREEIGEQVILSKSDMRMIDMTLEEKIEFFACTPITEERALELINENQQKHDEEDTSEDNEYLEDPDGETQESVHDNETKSVEGEEHE